MAIHTDRIGRPAWGARQGDVSMQGAAPSFLSLQGVSKRYGGVHALQNVTFSCGSGTIHAILGENGAGKSTLIKIMSGVVQPDEGSMTFGGTQVKFADPAAAN